MWATWSMSWASSSLPSLTIVVATEPQDLFASLPIVPLAAAISTGENLLITEVNKPTTAGRSREASSYPFSSISVTEACAAPCTPSTDRPPATLPICLAVLVYASLRTSATAASSPNSLAAAIVFLRSIEPAISLETREAPTLPPAAAAPSPPVIATSATEVPREVSASAPHCRNLVGLFSSHASDKDV